MNVLLASSEVHPFSKTGGLADMVGSLGKALARIGCRVGIVSPLHPGIMERFPGMTQIGAPFSLPLGSRMVEGRVWKLEITPSLAAYFVDQPDFYHRLPLYHKDGVDYPDNAERFVYLSKAIAHLALHLPLQPEIVHLNDWQVGMTALLLHHLRHQKGQGNVPRVCTTIHNLAYQGLFPASHYGLLNLPWDYYTPAGIEFYGKFSCLKAGVVYSDVVTTVSPRYAREITTPEDGCGFDGLLRQRNSTLLGILNGVDYEEWNTISDAYIEHPFSFDDFPGKALNKLALQKEFGLPVDGRIPLFGNIGRMVEQKGVDILHDALAEMLQSGRMQFVQLGTGTPKFQQAFLDLAKRFPQAAVVRIGFDEGLSHRIEAGCDFFLMPSRFEPCGLNQMYSLRYGTIPIVRATGGLDDTVVDIRENVEKANGIKFEEYSSAALIKAIRKALVLYDEPDLLQKFRITGMRADFSWSRTADQFLATYRRAMEGIAGHKRESGI